MPECVSTLRVRYVETDQMGVVHHSAYLAWMEVARTEYLRARGVPYRLLEEKGIRMPLLSVHAEYRVPARYDDEVELVARLAHADSGPFHVRIRNEEAGGRRPFLHGPYGARRHGHVRQAPPDSTGSARPHRRRS